ncbi:mechanosensitive ion channel [Candidatus Woesearchaeota archaeon]|nr:mechanosensitive ion channel [Candidatus Woesearchaeota archaeon]
MDFSQLKEIAMNIKDNNYLSALAIFIIFYLAAEIIKLITEKIFTKLARKTKTKLDDFLIKRTKRPISILLMFVGFRLALIALALGGRVEEVVIKITNSLIAIVTIYLTVVIVKVILDYWGETYAKKTKSTADDHLISVIKRAMNIFFFIAVLLAILQVWGVEIGPLLAGLGVGGIAIAFALQKSLGNVFGGISMILDKSISVGDVVVLENEMRGTIVDIGLRSTKIKTFDNEYVIVPNGKLEEMNIQNVVKPEPSIRIVIPFGVAYGSNVEKVKKVVLKEIEKVEGLDIREEEKKPFVRFLEMADSSLNFKAYFYIESYENRFESIDQATTLIYNALNKNKISIPFPQMDVHVKKR